MTNLQVAEAHTASGAVYVFIRREDGTFLVSTTSKTCKTSAGFLPRVRFDAPITLGAPIGMSYYRVVGTDIEVGKIKTSTVVRLRKYDLAETSDESIPTPMSGLGALLVQAVREQAGLHEQRL